MDRSKFKRKHSYIHHGNERRHESRLKNSRSGYKNNRKYENSHRSRRNHSSEDMVSLSYKILCPVTKARRGMTDILDSIGRETGARIHVPPLARGDRERIIEITGFQLRRASDSFSPAQKALFMVHDWIVDCGDDDNDGDVTSFLVVERGFIGSVLGCRGNIIQHLRRNSGAQILLLEEGEVIPCCLKMSDELLQIRGQVDDVKSAVVLISLLLRGRRLRHDCEQRNMPREGLMCSDRERGWVPSLDMVSVYDDGSCSDGFSGQSSRVIDFKPIEFLIVCPNDKADRLIRDTGGVMERLRNDKLVDVRIVDLEMGKQEKVIIISSTEYTEENLFPSQEALLHIQSQIVDIDSDTITTKLLVPWREIKCLMSQDGWLSKVMGLSGVDVQIFPREQDPLTVFPTYEIVHIVGAISAARDALIALTSLRRDYLYPNGPLPEDLRSLSNPLRGEAQEAGLTDQDQETTTSEDEICLLDEKENDPVQDTSGSTSSTSSAPLVDMITAEVVIPGHTFGKLIMGCKNELAQIRELSGASLDLVDENPMPTQTVIKMSGSPLQVSKAESLLHGLILCAQEGINQG